MVYIDDQHNLIFIENPKSGSTSIYKALNKVLGNNFSRDSPREAVHQTSEEVRKLVGENKWKHYLKVTTLRDPFKRFCSSCNFPRHHSMKNITDFESLEKHIRQVKEKKIKCYYCEPQEKFTENMDFVINLENIQKDFDTLCKKLNVTTTKIEHLNHNKLKLFCNEQLKQLYEK